MRGPLVILLGTIALVMAITWTSFKDVIARSTEICERSA